MKSDSLANQRNFWIHMTIHGARVWQNDIQMKAE